MFCGGILLFSTLCLIFLFFGIYSQFSTVSRFKVQPMWSCNMQNGWVRYSFKCEDDGRIPTCVYRNLNPKTLFKWRRLRGSSGDVASPACRNPVSLAEIFSRQGKSTFSYASTIPPCPLPLTLHGSARPPRCLIDVNKLAKASLMSTNPKLCFSLSLALKALKGFLWHLNLAIFPIFAVFKKTTLQHFGT